VNNKEQVNMMRNEPTTPAYALFDVGANLMLNKILKINFSISNVFDHYYSLPLGGVDLVNHAAISRTPVAGMGRSYNLAFNFEFL
jgi:iron complex outermembrane receptor protein